MEIIYTDQIVFGEKPITSVKVLPLNFSSFVKIWADAQSDIRAARNDGSNGSSALQRRRIMFQAQFMAGNDRVKPEVANILQLPLRAARSIIAALDEGHGEEGSLLNDADGISAPIHYKLGTPLTVTVNKTQQIISELEFSAKVYADVEDVLAADGEPMQAFELIKRCASPVNLESNVKILPSWALDQIRMSDGITIMRNVLPRFLE